MLEPPVAGGAVDPAAAVVPDPPLPAAAWVPALALLGALVVPPVPPFVVLGELWPAAAVTALVPAVAVPVVDGGGVRVGVVLLLPPVLLVEVGLMRGVLGAVEADDPA